MESLLDKLKDTAEKILAAPGTAALGFADEILLGALVKGLDALGYGASEYLEKNPDAAKAGGNVGFIVSLAGTPALAAKYSR